MLLSLVLMGPLLGETLSLAPRGGQDPQAAFHQTALTIKNTTNEVVRAVRFHSRGGGPIVVVDAVIPPEASGELIVPLPAIWAQQTYDVQLLALPEDDPTSQPLATLEAQVHWPPELVNTDRFLNWQYQQVQADPVHWPQSVKQNLLLTLVLGSLAMAAALLLRRRGNLRVLILGIFIAATTLVAAYVLGQVELVVDQPASITTGERPRELLILGSRRTASVKLSTGHVPVYTTRSELQRETMVIHVGHQSLVDLHPGSVRIFERAGETPSQRDPGPVSSPLPSSLPSP